MKKIMQVLDGEGHTASDTLHGRPMPGVRFVRSIFQYQKSGGCPQIIWHGFWHTTAFLSWPFSDHSVGGTEQEIKLTVICIGELPERLSQVDWLDGAPI